MFGFIKKVLFTAMTFFNFRGLSVNSLECVSMNNQESKIRSEITLLSQCFIPIVLQ